MKISFFKSETFTIDDKVFKKLIVPLQQTQRKLKKTNLPKHLS